MKREDTEVIVWEFKKQKTLTYKELSSFGEAMIYYALIGDKTTPPILKCEINQISFDNGNDVPIYNLSPDEVKSFYLKNSFSNSLKFQLTDYGNDVLYELKKARCKKRAQWIAIIIGATTFIATVVPPLYSLLTE